MKNILKFYRSNPFFALIINFFGIMAWVATTIALIVLLVAVIVR